MRTPERVIRPAAAAFLAVVAEHPADVIAGREQIIDLAAVIDGDQAPSLTRKSTVRRVRVRHAPQMTLDDAVAGVMGYAYPRSGSPVEAALNELRRAVLAWTPPGYAPTERHSAPAPRPNYRQRS